MCIILFAYKVHPRYQLILAGNRDEVYSRPTASLSFWEDYPQVLAGRDLLEFGTWMGISKYGHFAALTNFRDPQLVHNKPRSRGELVKEFLITEDSPMNYLKRVRNEKTRYNGFNLLVGDMKQLYYYSAQQDQILALQPGIYGLSNAHLDSPWPKVIHGKRELKRITENPAGVASDMIFEMLSNAEPATDDTLPHTGVGLELERLLSPLFIKSGDYGTRSSTSLTIDMDGMVNITERTIHNGHPTGVIHFSLQVVDSRECEILTLKDTPI